MKLFPIFFTLSISIIFLFSCASKLTISELNYGISDTPITKRIPMDSSLSGFRNVTNNDLNIIDKTDTIKAKLNLQFGTQYILNSKSDEYQTIEFKWIYPQVLTNEKGKQMSEVSYKVRVKPNKTNHASYNLDFDYEVVKGPWILEIRSKNKLLYTKTFILI